MDAAKSCMLRYMVTLLQLIYATIAMTNQSNFYIYCSGSGFGFRYQNINYLLMHLKERIAGMDMLA